MAEDTQAPDNDTRARSGLRSKLPKVSIADEPSPTPSAASGPAASAQGAEPAAAAADANAKGTGAAFLDASSKAAGSAKDRLKSGLAAMRQVHAASKEHSTARDHMASIQQDLAADQAELDHRNDIEAHFDAIVQEQSAELADATKDHDAAQAEIDALNAKHEELAKQLEQLKADHEQELRPYKNLAESTRSRADDASKSLADAKRAVRNAEAQVQDASNRRDARVATATRAVDNAQARLAKLQDELAALKRDPSSSKPVSELNSTVAAEMAHLKTARDEVTSITAEAQRTVDNAQTHLWTQKQSLESAQKAADAARQEANQRKAEYDKLLQDAETEEATLDNEAVTKEMRIREVTKDLKAAQDRIDTAQALLDEANDIHSTPESTRDLAERVSDEKAALEVQQRQVDLLAQNEQTLREHTRQERAVFIAIVVAVALIVLLVLWLVIPH